MKKIVFSLSITAMIVLIISCGEKKQERIAEEKAIAVTVDIAAPRDLNIGSVYTGSLEGLKQAQIFASIPEAVVDLPIPEGNPVSAGQPIIYLDKKGSFSQYNQSHALYIEAKDNHDKMAKLYEQGAVSEQNYISAKTRFEVAQANFKSARQQVELTSPISGILTDLSVNIGEYVSMEIPLATVAQTDLMRLTIFVDSQSASHIKKGQRAEVGVEILGRGTPEFEGVVNEVSRSADPETRLFKVEIQIDNANGELRPGLFARAYITVAELKSVLTVPNEAVFSVEGISKAFKLQGDRAREITVVTGSSTLEYTQILSGLSEGDTVMVIGRNLVEHGSLVRIAEKGNGDDEKSPAAKSAEKE